MAGVRDAMAVAKELEEQWADVGPADEAEADTRPLARIAYAPTCTPDHPTARTH